MEVLLPDIKIIRQKFYDDEKKNKNAQDNKLAQMMNVNEIKMQRKKKNGKSHNFHTEFYVSFYLNKSSFSSYSFLDYRILCNVSLIDLVFF